MNKYSPLRHSLFTLIAALTLCVFLAPAHANDLDNSSYETLIWKGNPLRIHIQSGQETLIKFPSPVQIGPRPDMVGMVDAMSIKSTVHLTPLSDFKHSRFRFRRLDTGDIIVIDIQSSPDGASALFNVVDSLTSNDEATVLSESNSRRTAPEYGYIDLARFAFQQVYSPERLQEPLKGLGSISIKDKQPILDLVAGENIAAIPWGQWKSPNGLYVTAVYLNNLSSFTVSLDPRRFRHSDQWLATSLYSGHLTPSATLGDSTTMVVIGTSAWDDAVTWLR